MHPWVHFFVQSFYCIKLGNKIDLIVTKSVSRFARNTVDSLTTIRKLKEHNVEVFFEKENILTFDSKGEILITIMSSLSQEESRSISENVTWGQRKRMADGKVSLPYKNFLGYRKGENGIPEIVPEEAKIVREIYRMFMIGMTQGKIANELMKRKIPSPSGREKWYPSTIMSILTNEKYKGSAILQKRFTVDFLTKKTKVNEGEVPQYYVEDSHPAIIPPDEFELVQVEIMRRKELGAVYSGRSPFSTKIVCGCCGGFYGSKVWHSTDKYRKVIWRCNEKYNGNKCNTPHLNEKEIEERFLEACQIVMEDKATFIESCRQVSDILSDTTDLETQEEKIWRERQEEECILSGLIRENAAIALDQNEFQRRCKPHEDRLTEIYAEINDIHHKVEKRKKRKTALDIMINRMSSEIFTTETFDGDTFAQLVEKITVHEDGTMIFLFMNGFKIETKTP